MVFIYAEDGTSLKTRVLDENVNMLNMVLVILVIVNELKKNLILKHSIYSIWLIS